VPFRLGATVALALLSRCSRVALSSLPDLKATVAAFRLGLRSEGRKKTAGEIIRLASNGTTGAPFEKSVTAPKFISSLDWRRGERAKNVSNARILSQNMAGADRRRDPFPLKLLSRSSEAKLEMVCQEIVNYQMRGPCPNSKMHGPCANSKMHGPCVEMSCGNAISNRKEGLGCSPFSPLLRALKRRRLT
jgi:hypothetical protein